MDEGLTVVIRADGTVEAVYSDEIATLFDHPTFAPVVTRASHVEPADGGGWFADMRPSLPPGVVTLPWLLGPFPTRAEALSAERAWLREHKGL